MTRQIAKFLTVTPLDPKVTAPSELIFKPNFDLFCKRILGKFPSPAGCTLALILFPHNFRLQSCVLKQATVWSMRPTWALFKYDIALSGVV